jgi:hypothetical protein
VPHWLQAWQPTRLFVESACTGDIVLVQDSGNGSCTVAYQLNGTFVPGGQPCTNLFGGVTCGSFTGIISIFITRQQTTATYVQPNIQAHLTAIGLGSIVALKETLVVSVQNSPNPIPVNVAPIFLTSLRRAGAIIVRECANCDAESIAPPTTSRLTALPGLAGIQALTSTKELQVVNTAFTSMGSFAGLTCPPDTLTITNNKQLATLNGLNSISTFTTNIVGPSITITGNNLTSAASISAVSVYFFCTGANTPLFGPVNIEVQGCGTLLVCPLCFVFLSHTRCDCFWCDTYEACVGLVSRYHMKLVDVTASDVNHLNFVHVFITALYSLWCILATQ